MAVVIVDTREHLNAIDGILAHFDAAGVKHVFSKLYVGDYQRLDNGLLVVDRKQSLLELAGNVTQQHERFRAELKRAEEAGIHLVILCEHGNGITSMNDVEAWQNPRLRTSPKAITGYRLAQILRTLETRYGVEFQFCKRTETGEKILEILGA